MSTSPDLEDVDIDKIRLLVSSLERLLKDRQRRTLFVGGNQGDRYFILKDLYLPLELEDDLLQLLIGIGPDPEPPNLAIAGAKAKNTSGNDADQLAHDEFKRWNNLLMGPFTRIKGAYLLSTVMSVSLFIVGLSLFVIAANRAITSGNADSGTLLIAGIGAVDFLALVYTRPLRDMAGTLVATQRAGVLATFYLAGLALVLDPPDPRLPGEPGALANLERITKLAIDFGKVQSDTAPQHPASESRSGAVQ